MKADKNLQTEQRRRNADETAAKRRLMPLAATTLQGLQRLAAYRSLTTAQFGQAAGLSTSRAGRVLRELETKGWLGSFGNVGLYNQGKSPKCYYLTPKGWAGVEEAGIPLGRFTAVKTAVRWSPLMWHRIALVDVLLSLEAGVAARPRLEVPWLKIEYRREQRGEILSRETSDRVGTELIVPDAVFALENVETRHARLCFLEVDLGTEPVTERSGSSVIGKMALYDRYLHSLAWQQRWGVFDTCLVLWVVKGAERMENIRRAAAALDADLHLITWLTSLDTACAGFLEALWCLRDPTSNEWCRLIEP